jgi:hypothetical protein
MESIPHSREETEQRYSAGFVGADAVKKDCGCKDHDARDAVDNRPSMFQIVQKPFSFGFDHHAVLRSAAVL